MSYCQPAQIYLAIACALLIITLVAKPDVHIGLLSSHIICICSCFIFLLGLCQFMPGLAWLFTILVIVGFVLILVGGIRIEDYAYMNQDDYITLSGILNDRGNRQADQVQTDQNQTNEQFRKLK
jgi:hypothetical protein